MSNITNANQYLDEVGLARFWDAVLDSTSTIYQCLGTFDGQHKLILTSVNLVRNKVQLNDVFLVHLISQDNSVKAGIYGSDYLNVYLDEQLLGSIESMSTLFTGCSGNETICGSILLICEDESAGHTLFNCIPLSSMHSSMATLLYESADSSLYLNTLDMINPKVLLPVVTRNSITKGEYPLIYEYPDGTNPNITIEHDIPSGTVIEFSFLPDLIKIANYGTLSINDSSTLKDEIKDLLPEEASGGYGVIYDTADDVLNAVQVSNMETILVESELDPLSQNIPTSQAVAEYLIEHLSTSVILTVTEGTKIATINDVDIYAPESGDSSSPISTSTIEEICI